MSISPQEEEAITRLNANLGNYEKPNKVAKSYYDGTIVPPSLKMKSGTKRVTESSIGWGKIAVDSLNERLSVQGFVGSDGEENPYGIDKIIDQNGLESVAGEAFKESLIKGTSFMTVAAGADFYDPDVLLSPHDSSFATADYSLRSRNILVGLTVFPDDPERGELLTPNSIIPFGISEGAIFQDGERIDHNLGRVPMVQFNESPDAGSSKGHSAITVPMRKQIDFVIRTMDDTELNRVLFAWGQRYLATDQKFVDADGNPIDPFIAAQTALWKIPLNTNGTNPVVGHFPSNSPKDLLDLIRQWASTFAAEAGLPEYYFGVTQQSNPTSADAIRAGEARLIKKSWDRTRQFTRPMSEVAMLALLIRDGRLPDGFTGLRPIWGNVATISPGAAADRALKLVSQGILQPTSRIVLDELGYNKAQQDQIIQENNAASAGMIRRILANQTQIEGEIVEPDAEIEA